MDGAQPKPTQMPPQKCGDTFSITVPITDQTGAPVDITGATVTFKIATSLGATGSQIVVRKSTADDISITGSSIAIDIAPADTQYLRPGVYWFEIRVTDVRGIKFTPVYGTVEFLPSMGS